MVAIAIKKKILSTNCFGETEGKVIATELHNTPEDLKIFIEEFLGSDIRFRQRAAWVLVELAKNHPSTLESYLSILKSTLIQSSQDSIKRNILRVFQFIEFPKGFHEEMINYCFDILTSKEEAIAIQVFAMSVLYKLIGDYPELQRELKIILEDQLPYASAGYKSRAKQVLKALS